MPKSCINLITTTGGLEDGISDSDMCEKVVSNMVAGGSGDRRVDVVE